MAAKTTKTITAAEAEKMYRRALQSAGVNEADLVLLRKMARERSSTKAAKPARPARIVLFTDR